MIDTTLEYSLKVGLTCFLLLFLLLIICGWLKGIRGAVSEKTWKTISNIWVVVTTCDVMVFFLSCIVSLVFWVIKIWQ